MIYHGPIKDSWYNVITEEIKALSMYSVWFPQELPLKNIEDRVVIKNDADLFVVKGVFDNKKHVWHYGGKGYDPFNIIAYKKSVLKISSNDYLNIYYVDPSIEKYANKAELAYKDILSFYNGKLFILDQRLENIGQYPPIKTPDGSRPDGVHNKGTVLFYEIYQKYGKDILTKMVHGFTELKIKNTENFINFIEYEISKEVAEEIKRGIEKKT